MAKLFLTPIDLNKNELLNHRLHNSASDITTPVEGQIYFKTEVADADQRIRYFNGTSWVVIDHDSLPLYVANEHIDHTTVSVTAGAGLSGGGDISITRTIDLDFSGTELTESTDLATGDRFAIYDASAAGMRYITYDNVLTELQTDLDFTQYTFENGLTETAGTVKLGGALTGDTSINAGSTYSLTVTGSDAASVMFVSNTSGNGAAIQATATGTGAALSGQNSAGGYGVYATSATGPAIYGSTGSSATAYLSNGGSSINDTPIDARINADTTDFIRDLARFSHYTTGTAATGFGGGLSFYLENASGTIKNAGRLAFDWTDATNLSEDSRFTIDLITAGAPSQTKLELSSVGGLTLNAYGAGNRTGTPVNILAVTSAGAVVESEIGGTVSAFADAAAFGSGDKLLIYDTSAGVLAKIDYDDLPGAAGTVGYTTVTGDTGTASATGAETLNFTGTGIVTAVTAGATDEIAFSLDFTELTNETALDAADEFAFYDASALAMRAITYTALLTELETDLNISNYTFENGLTETTGTVKLGGTLTADTTIDAGTASTLIVTGTDTTQVMSVTNTSGNGKALSVSSTGAGQSIYSYASGSGKAVEGTTIGSGYGVYATSTSLGRPFGAVKEVANGNEIGYAAHIIANTSATPANDLGAGITFAAETSTTVSTTQGNIAFRWTDVTHATRTSAFDVQTVNNAGVETTRLSLAGTGQLTLNAYGSGTFTGTAAKWLAVTSDGIVIEENAPAFAADAYSSFAGDTGGVISATGEEQINFVGGTGISTVSAAGSPDSLTIDIDTNSEVTFGASADWTFDNSATGLGLFVTGTPVDGNHAVNKTYVDNLAVGLDAKASVRVATTAAGTLASSFENGDTVDGVVLSTGDRILIKNQAAAAENGIYTVNATGAPTRTTDMDSWDELVSAYVWVEEGTVNADSGWLCTADQGGTLGTTGVTWVLFASATGLIAGAGLSKTGNQIDLDVNDLTDLAATAAPNDYIAIYDTTAASTKKVSVTNLIGARKYAATTDVGTAEGAVIVNHALNTTDVIVQIYDSTTKDVVELDIDITDVNNVTIQAAGSTRSVRVVVLG